MKSRIYIVDDHSLVRQGLKSVISAEENLEVCGEADDSRVALTQIIKLRPDVALIDISLKGNSGLELIKSIKAFDASIHIIVLSMHPESVYALRALRAGAQGYVMKGDAINRVTDAIAHVQRGHLYVSEDVANQMWTQLVGGEKPHDASNVDILSDRELEVVNLIGLGLSTRQIATRLNVSPKTVDTHRAHIKEKMGLRTSAQLSRFCFCWVNNSDIASARSAALE